MPGVCDLADGHVSKDSPRLNYQECVIQGQTIPSDLLGELKETHFRPDSGPLVRERLSQCGYLFLRGVLDVDSVMAAREEVFGRLAEVGEIRHPPRDGIATGTSKRRELVADLGNFGSPSVKAYRDARTEEVPEASDVYIVRTLPSS